MLSSLIKDMPDVLVEKTFHSSLINSQTFIVLAQNSSAEMREAVIKVIYLDYRTLQLLYYCIGLLFNLYPYNTVKISYARYNEDCQAIGPTNTL